MVTDNMSAYGDYIINSGKVRIRPQNIKTLEFTIQQGSKLNLVGDPMNTSFDITAYYRVNASLNALNANLSRAKIPVDCILGIKGSMNNMELSYDISLPNADDDTKQRVRALINTDDEKVKQFGNLIIFNNFRPVDGVTNNVGGNMLGSLAANTLSGAFNSLFGNVLGSNWQIGANIDSSDDGSFADAATVNISTRLLDDRLTLNTNLGYRSDLSTTNETTFVGDFDIEYQLSRVLKLRAYNHTNDRFYKRAETTQGIGIVYTKEARTLKRLFNFFGKKKNDK